MCGKCVCKQSFLLPQFVYCAKSVFVSVLIEEGLRRFKDGELYKIFWNSTCCVCLSSLKVVVDDGREVIRAGLLGEERDVLS